MPLVLHHADDLDELRVWRRGTDQNPSAHDGLGREQGLGELRIDDHDQGAVRVVGLGEGAALDQPGAENLEESR